jgi:hypothetical protein
VEGVPAAGVRSDLSDQQMSKQTLFQALVIEA